MSKRTTDFSKLHILIVENHALMRRLLVEMLRGFGVQHIYQAGSVPEAVDIVYGEKLDAVILDFFLGDMDGADFAKRFRHDAACFNREVPILLITSMPDHHKVLKVLDAGINGMLAKPIAPKDLYNRLHVMLADPKPFVVTRDYVGPMRNRTKPPVSKRLLRPTPFKASAPSRKRPEQRNPVYEDGILL